MFYALYQIDLAVLGIGRTPEEAIGDASQYLDADMPRLDEIRYLSHVVPEEILKPDTLYLRECTRRLFEAIEENEVRKTTISTVLNQAGLLDLMD